MGKSDSKSGFGARLQRERELRGVLRDEICTATRISTRYLEALENEQWATLPGGVFNRGFVRAVARFLGLDEDDLLAEYDLATSEQNSEIEPLGTAVPQERKEKRSSAFIWIVALCGLFLFVGGGWLGWRWHYNTVSLSNTQPASAMQVTVPAERAPSGVPADSAAAANTSAAASSSDAGSTTETQALQLKIEAGKETSVSVSADGNKVFEGNIIAGQSRTFTAQGAIDISAKDAGALLLELNGQTLAPLGPPGQPGNATLTRSNLKPTGGGAD
jgi:cytoskeleton protein RodZ